MACFERNRARFLGGLLVVSLLCPAQCFALNCVQYVRSVTGMDISGDGWQWWNNADGRFERGHMPKESAVMVFDRSGSMEHGHVAIVSHLMNPRLITINHANWAHFRSLKGHVSTGVMVQDVSDRNDWSEVKVWDEESRSFGRSNRILGFVYNKPGSSNGSMVAQAQAQPAARAVEPDAGIKDIDNE